MELHELDATALSERLEAGETTSKEIVDALFERANAVNPRINALIHRFENAARQQAEALDAERAAGNVRGPLHGLPITIKESIATVGTASTLGLAKRKDRVQTEDAVIVKLLRDAGAIVLGKTNVSQLLLFNESDNPVFGRCKNPWNLDRTPGGSSGGEAAAIASGISPWGIGGDIGGSVRVPCAYTGLAGMRPTVDRWSGKGSFTALMGQEVIRGTNGPLARSARDVALLIKSIDSPLHTPYDPAVPPLPTEDPAKVDLTGLTVGWYDYDGYLEASAGLRRAVRTARDALAACGATVVEFAPPLGPEIMDCYFAALSSDGGQTASAALEGEDVAEQLVQLMRVARLPPAARKAAALAMKLKKEHRVVRMLTAVHQKSVADLWKLTAERTRLRAEVFAAWTAADLDLVLCPPHSTVALRHGQTKEFSAGGSYAMRYNFLNFPSGIVPVGRVRADETERVARDRFERVALAADRGSQGLPTAVQVVGRPYEESKILAAMLAIEASVRDNEDFPKTPVTP